MEETEGHEPISCAMMQVTMRGASSLRPTSVGDNQAKRQERKNECSKPRSLHSKRKQHVFEELDDGVKEEASQKCG